MRSRLLFLCGLIALSLAAIQSFTLNQMPETADGRLHLHRLAAVDYSLRADNPFWLRYSTGLVYGYGAPLFNYFPALSYYPGSWLHGLGLSFVSSWLVQMVLYVWLAAGGMFLLGRLWTGSPLAGWLAAAAYVYAPFVLFDALSRGAAPEMAALAMLPWAMAGLTRLAWYGRRRDWLIASLSMALFIPLHTLITLHGTVMLGVYALFLWQRADDKKRTARRLMLAFALPWLMTAFYWLLALTETAAIKIDLIVDSLGHIDVTRHLRPLPDILALPHTADPTWQNQDIPIALGWPQLLLSTLGLILSHRRSCRRWRGLMLTLGVLVLALTLMNTPHSAWLWKNLPLIAYTQFPWRLLGLASPLLALMTALSVWMLWTSIRTGWRKWALVILVMASLMLYALPWTYTLYEPPFRLDDIRDVHRFERQTGQLALSSYSEYLPITADARQLDPHRLTERFDSSDIIPRLLPSDTLTLISQRWTSASGGLRLDSAIKQTLQFDWLYVPGWTANLNGQPLDVFPSPAGLVSVDLPAGEFDLQIALGPTPMQSLSHLLTLLGWIGLLIVTVLWRRLNGPGRAPRPGSSLSARLSLLMISLGLAIFLFKSLALDPTDSLWKTTRFGDNPSDARPLATFGNVIDLLHAEMPSDSDNDKKTFKLYWRLHDQPIDHDYSSAFRMRDPQGHLIAQATSFMPGGLASSNWLPGAYVEDVIDLAVPPFTPPLDEPYRYEVSLFDAKTQTSLHVINAAGNPQDVKVVIGERLHHRPAPDLPVDSHDERAAALHESPSFPDEATAGDVLPISWIWQKGRSSYAADDLMAQIRWINRDSGQTYAAAARALVTGYPFRDWPPGQINRGHHDIIVPPRIPTGSYDLAIQLLDDEEDPHGGIIRLNKQIALRAPPRQFDAPQADFPAQAVWDNGLILRGYSFRAPGELQLIWQTKHLLPENLRLFVHALDERGLIAAQWDGIPVDWTRPTTGWLPGEYVTTRHALDLPPSRYPLRIGWYHPTSGQRIGIDEANALTLNERLRIE